MPLCLVEPQGGLCIYPLSLSECLTEPKALFCTQRSQIWVSINWKGSPGSQFSESWTRNPRSLIDRPTRRGLRAGRVRQINNSTLIFCSTSQFKKKNKRSKCCWIEKPLMPVNSWTCSSVGRARWVGPCNFLVTDKILRFPEHVGLAQELKARRSWVPEQTACCCRMDSQGVCESGVWDPILSLAVTTVSCGASQPLYLVSCPPMVPNSDSLRQSNALTHRIHLEWYLAPKCCESFAAVIHVVLTPRISVTWIPEDLIAHPEKTPKSAF